MKKQEEDHIKIPINVQTRGAMMDFSQMGILTTTNHNNNNNNNNNNKSTEILPLMGRQLTLGSSDKWQYYTYANNGNTFVQTRLPIMVKGRDASGEYGCDRLYTDDVVYVEGYGEQFRVKIYENSLFTYIPVI